MHNNIWKKDKIVLQQQQSSKELMAGGKLQWTLQSWKNKDNMIWYKISKFIFVSLNTYFCSILIKRY